MRRRDATGRLDTTLAWSSEHRRGPSAIGLAAIVALWFGCFDGAGALGYPCESDADCGPSLACEDTGCCGGACLLGSEGGTQSTTTSGATESSTGSSSTTIDPTTESSSSSSSSSGEPVPECGNGVVEEGEECDLGDRNEMGVFVECNENCRAALFHFDSMQMHDGDFCEDASCEPWVLEGGDEGAWVSGPYPVDPSLHQLVSRRFIIPDPPPDRVPAMRISHDFDFNDCEIEKGMPEYFDGGHVLIQDAADVLTHVSPISGEGHAHVPSCTGSDTPWCLTSVPPAIFAGNGDGTITRVVPIEPQFWGEEVRLVFEAGFDTDNCMDGNEGRDPDPWRILEVVVAFDAA
jgi:hypothetical protein